MSKQTDTTGPFFPKKRLTLGGVFGYSSTS